MSSTPTPLTDLDPSTLTAEERVEFDKKHSLAAFVEAHKPQLEGMKLPKYLWKPLHKKLYEGKYAVKEDSIVSIEPVSTGGYQVKAKAAIRKWSDIWIVAHPFVATKEQIIDRLKSNPDLVAYLWAVFDMDSLVMSEEEAAAAAASKAAAAAARAAEAASAVEARAAAAAAVGSHDDADPLMVSILVEQTGVTEEAAAAALVKTRNDLVEAIALCGPQDAEAEERAEMSKELEGRFTNTQAAPGAPAPEIPSAADTKAAAAAAAQAEAEAAAAAAAEAAAKAEAAKKSKKEGGKSDEEKQMERIASVVNVMFQGRFANALLTAKPRGPDSPYTGPLHPNEILRTYYVPDEFGCALGFAPAASANVKVEPFVMMTVSGVAVSLVWPEKDIPEGGVLYQPVRPAEPNPFAPRS